MSRIDPVNRLPVYIPPIFQGAEQIHVKVITGSGIIRYEIMKVGILTYHRAYNYGAYLQACALCNRLNEEADLDAEIIDYRMEKEVLYYDVRRFPLRKKLGRLKNGTWFFDLKLCSSFEEAVNDPVMKRSKDSLVSDSISDFSDFVRGKYDAIIVGSDEIWKVNRFRGFPNAYWLPGELGCRKLSYAASARVQFEESLPGERYEQLQSAVRDFEYLGVRDQFTFDEVKKAADPQQVVELCCDPSFLYDFRLGQSRIMELLADERRFDPQKKTVMVMLDDDHTAKQILKYAGKRYNLISVFHKHSGYINVPGLKPLEWLDLIDTVDLVVASFFHAVCFSIVRNRPFLAIGTRGKKSKITELLSADDLKKHYLEPEEVGADFAEMMEDYMHPVNFSSFVAEKRAAFGSFLSALKH